MYKIGEKVIVVKTKETAVIRATVSDGRNIKYKIEGDKREYDACELRRKRKYVRRSKNL